MSTKSQNLELFAGPSDLGAPDKLENAVVKFIDSARIKLDIAVRELQCKPIAEAIIHDAQTAAIYTREFNEIQLGRFGRQKGKQTTFPPVIRLDQLRIKILFAPEHNPEMEIMKQMMTDQKSEIQNPNSEILNQGRKQETLQP